MVMSSGPAARKFPMFLKACETITGKKQDIELSSRHFFKEPPLENQGGRVAGMRNRGGK